MIFFVAPDQESLVNVVVDTATSGPVAASVGSLEEAITFLEQEVVIDELLLDLLGHSGERVESSLQFTFQSGEGGRDFFFHLLVLGLSQAGVEGVSLHRAAATDAGRDDVFALRVQVAQSFDISEVTSGVLVASFESGVVVADDGVEQVSKHGVRLGIGGIDTNTRVQILHTFRSNKSMKPSVAFTNTPAVKKRINTIRFQLEMKPEKSWSQAEINPSS